MCIASGKSRSAKVAYRQPRFMDSCLKCLSPVYQVHMLIFICFVPLSFSHGGASGSPFDVFQGQNYVTLLRGNEMSAGFHHKNWILGI